jgi:hypothetical protein
MVDSLDWDALTRIEWEPIDEVHEDRGLKIPGSVKYFECIAEYPFSLFRFRQIELNLDDPPSNYLAFRRIEFFGSIVPG